MLSGSAMMAERLPKCLDETAGEHIRSEREDQSSHVPAQMVRHKPVLCHKRTRSQNRVVDADGHFGQTG
jgi:hypothetical protein